MHTVRVKLDKRSYDIVIGRNIIPSLGGYIKRLDIGESAYIITNPLVKSKCSQALTRELKKSGLKFKIRIIPDTEKSKSIATLSSVINDLAKFDKKSRTFIIALGGGVVGDLSGLVASMYKRGIPYIQIPTTLLAQVDSAIGGKTAVDLREGKNLIGSIYQPRLVFSDVKLLESLEPRQLRAGLAEIIKYGLIKDSRLFVYLERECKNILKLEPRALEHVVNCSSRIKADIVSRDEREAKGLRTVLNFGHTTAHALEAVTGFNKYNHGEAVALGMLVALDISRSLGLINSGLNKRAQRLIKAAGLPLKIDRIPLKKIMDVFYRDKKFIGAKARVVLITGLARPKVAQDVPSGIIEEAIRNRIKR